MKQAYTMFADTDPEKVCVGGIVAHSECYGLPFWFTPAAEWRKVLPLTFLKKLTSDYSYGVHHSAAHNCAAGFDAFLASHGAPFVFGLFAYGDFSLLKSVY
jgi:hypothetical protein